MKRFFGAVALGGGIFSAAHAVSVTFPGLTEMLRIPAAWLAGCFLGVPVDFSAPVPVLLHPEVVVEVVPSCAGAEFFALLLGSAAGLLCWHRAPWWHGVVLLAAAVGLTIAANAARIVCAVQTRMWSGLLPAALPDDALHLAVGAGVFAVVLILVCRLLPCLYENAPCRPD
jgi:exosortase/archaeosortase family protein